MDNKTVLGMAAGVSALALMAGVETSVAQTAMKVMSPSSYTELLQPIPDAASLLQVVDKLPSPKAKVEKVNHHHHHNGGGYHHHHHHGGWGYHHHHHHSFGWPWGRHHHHHHHY